MRKIAKRCFVIGLDSAPPSFIFDEYKEDIPNLSKLRSESAYGALESCIPPITVPAWTCMMSGKNPGWHGCFGFRNRKPGTYDDMWIATNKVIREDRVWDILGRMGKRVCLVGIPQTYPPREVNGIQVAGFLTPDTIDCHYTHPMAIKEEIYKHVGYYPVDVMNYRTEDKPGLLDQIYDKTTKHFDVAEMLLEKEKWDFFMMVEMGPDRIQHGMWKFVDPGHRKYDSSNEYKDSIREYYRFVDEKVGRILRFADEDTLVMVVSDHGAKRMDGCININDWLIREGYLKLKSQPAGVSRFSDVEVDWKATTAWAWGGYYSRIFLNVMGREPHGVVPPAEYEAAQNELADKLRAIPDDEGRPMATRVYRPQDIYTGPRAKEAPDLIVYFGDLHWRAGQDVGHDSIYSFETEIGPDDAVHDDKGIIMVHGGEARSGKVLEDAKIYDVSSTVLDAMGLAVPPGMEGKVLDVAS